MERIIILFFLLFSSYLSSQVDLNLVEVASGFNAPVAIANANDGSDRLFVVEQAGVIKILDIVNDFTILPTDFLDISGRVRSGGERGLLGLSFHPDFPNTPHFYVNYTFEEGGQLKTKIERYSLSADPNIADANSNLQILEVDQPYSNHNAGDLKFGPDGYLYVTMGDGGAANDPDSLSQNVTNLLGSLLRVDVDVDDFPLDAKKNYGIPANNPFVTNPDFASEIWAYGLRNPWRISFDRETGDLFIADVGQNEIEEVNKQLSTSTGGENYGWSCKEGTVVQNYNLCLPGPLTDPVFEYQHNLGRSITGGFVYRGNAFSNLIGYYIFTDFSTGNYWLLNTNDLNDVTRVNLTSGISSFGESEAGELYVAKLSSGRIFRVVDLNECPEDIIVTNHDESFFSSNNSITSDVPIDVNDSIVYISPSIEAEPPFLVSQTAQFTALSITCLEEIVSNQY